MNARLKINILEVTRLTRDGRLDEGCFRSPNIARVAAPTTKSRPTSRGARFASQGVQSQIRVAAARARRCGRLTTRARACA
jgi:hypothetical protein